MQHAKAIQSYELSVMIGGGGGAPGAPGPYSWTHELSQIRST